jgi:hypothetical protein
MALYADGLLLTVCDLPLYAIRVYFGVSTP